jgi:hypothetical protein
MCAHTYRTRLRCAALVDLLDSELKAEKDIYTQTHGEQPLTIDGWTFTNDRAEVKLTKQHNNEK